MKDSTVVSAWLVAGVISWFLAGGVIGFMLSHFVVPPAHEETGWRCVQYSPVTGECTKKQHREAQP